MGRKPTLLKFLQLCLFLVLCNLRLISTLRSRCKVSVESPWPMPGLLVPANSTVVINCILENSIWLIDLVDEDTSLLFLNRREQLNALGLYELIETPEMPLNGTRGLLINNTASNNGTVIQCVGNSQSYKSSLLVYEPKPAIKEVTEISVQSINISWDHVPPIASVNQSYSLTISHGSHSEIIPLSQSYYNFIAPEGAPPCEVYNFSVTASYDIAGITYTGTGCSVPSQVISRMLPSLPDINMLESSLLYSLQKDSSDGIKMRVTFMPAKYCEMYPVTGYVLEVGLTSHSQSHSNGTLSVNNLLDNQVYSFSVVVLNSVGNVSTGSKTIYTTDVQTVTALPQEDNSFLVQCNFLAGSNARGCMVILVGEFENTTGNVTRDSKCTSHTAVLSTTYPLSNYSTVFGYDIESDGSIGTLAVPGVIVRDPAPILPCVPEELKPHPNQNIPTWIIIIIGVILGVALVTITVIIVFVVSCRLVRRSRTEKHYHMSRPWPTSSAGPAPVTPPSAPNQDFTDEDGDTKKPQPIYDQPEKITIPKEEHAYHVLETSTPRYQFKQEDFQHNPGSRLIPPHAHDAKSPTHSESDSSPCDPPPIYQDIADIPLIRVRHSGRAGANGQENHSPSSELPPVYHEITEVQPSNRTSSRLHDDIPSAGTNI